MGASAGAITFPVHPSSFVTALPVPVAVVIVFLFTGTVVSPITVRGRVAAVATAATLLSSLGAAMVAVTHCEVWAVDSIWVGVINFRSSRLPNYGEATLMSRISIIKDPGAQYVGPHVALLVLRDGLVRLSRGRRAYGHRGISYPGCSRGSSVRGGEVEWRG